MALPAHLLERLPAELQCGQNIAQKSMGFLPFGLPGMDEVLPDRGIPRGAVVELAVSGGVSLATSLALAACRTAQKEATLCGGEVPWCAFVDPSATLYAPGVVAAGVKLDRLLVVRPSMEALERTAIRLVGSHAFSIVVVDTMGVPGSGLSVALGAWPRVIRRLTLLAEESSGCVLLVTDGEVRRPLPLPVAMRLELARPSQDRLWVRVAKDHRGRVTVPRLVTWARPRAKPLSIAPEGEQKAQAS